ncbi:hypothetical protein [Breoghania sp.]|uniref:hypothetical protein n=1 Tax=Breoghania sp. TaxID=2065378 RepID=UPI002637E83D|nr:hypothetical protein [Breoghania sp.]MDJ0931399.1 hypothetical protein [Breoghania sp.]
MFLVGFCVICSTGLLGILIYNQVRTSTEEQASAKIASQTRLMAQRFDQAHLDIVRDLQTIMDTPPITGIMRAKDNAGIDPNDSSTTELWRARLAMIFQAVLRSRPEYFQFRFIGADDQGREIVRVDRTDRGLLITDEPDLQQKASEPYFKLGLNTPGGLVALSDITLNREKGTVDPRKIYTIRGVMPVDDGAGRRFGFLVINADYEQMLRNAFRQTPRQSHTIALNNAGDYMEHKPGERFNTLKFVPHDAAEAAVLAIVKEIRKRSEHEGLVEAGDQVAYFFLLPQFRRRLPKQSGYRLRPADAKRGVLTGSPTPYEIAS